MVSQPRYRVGVVGVAHMHVCELMRRFAELPNVDLVAISDTVPDVPELNTTSPSTRAHTLRWARAELGVPREYADYRELLERERPDIAILCPENSRHGEVATAALAVGAHLVTEKPMAASLAEARAMAEAAQRAGRTLMVNYPSSWSPAVRTLERLVDEARAADGRHDVLWQLHERHGSLGPLAAGSTHPGGAGTTDALTDAEKAATWWYRAGTGGGALLDYCSYGACLARWFFGEPAEAVSAYAANLASPYGQVEDNAVLTVRFPRGIAILEATWSCVDHAMPTGPILYGRFGTLSIDGPLATGRVRWVQERGAPPVFLPGDPLPPGRETVAREFLHHLETGEPLHPTLDPRFNLEAMAILDAGIRSAASGRVEPVERLSQASP